MIIKEKIAGTQAERTRENKQSSALNKKFLLSNLQGGRIWIEFIRVAFQPRTQNKVEVDSCAV